MNKRLSPVVGEWINRTQPIDFIFEGKRYWGYEGDTISSALWASGQRILGRSFKYHRPRGILSFADRDINALMQDGQKLNIRADVTPLTPGMQLEAVNTFGGVESDKASVINFFSPFLPVGFYYKAFHNKRLFPFWERTIRKISGLGKVDPLAPHIRTPKRYDFCDVLIIGAGASGLTAALAAAESGADVVIVDESAETGGSARYQLVEGLLKAVEYHPQIRVYTGTQAAGYYADNWIPLVNSNYLSKMRAKTVIAATGAYEQPAVFRNNDLPGVMLASAAQRLIYRYAVKPMQRAVVLVANKDGYQAALDLADNGVTVMAVVDLRKDPPVNELMQKVRSLSIPIYSGYYIYEAKPNPGGDGVASAVISSIDNQGITEKIACDGIVMSVGWAGAANLLYQAGTKMRFDDFLQQFVPEILPSGIYACGRVNGVFDFDQKLLDGRRAGLEAAKFLGLGDEKVDIAIAPENESPTCEWAIFPHPDGKEFVDFDEDLQYKDFINAIAEGFDNIELLKRYTTVGMGPSQGKHSNMNALRILAKVTGKSPGEVGTTTARPFFHPVPMSHLAGRGFTPFRQTPLHSRHVALGAKFMQAGMWQRPEYYMQLGKSKQECVEDEVIAVRDRIGIIDVGTLGKIEIRGADAAEFLERVYTGRYSNMKVGTTRYALMLDESGVIVDDGVIAKVETEHFYFTTTTGGATNIYRELSRLLTMWQLDCGIVNLTGARSAVNLAGRYAREVLAKLTDLDLSSTAFPYLAVREAEVANIPALLMRVGFVGEWGYEIHIAAEYAATLWDALIEAGKDDRIAAFGVEAQRVLRLEKGHLIVSQDTDGLTTPRDANLEWAVKMDKPFFTGQRSLQIVAKREVKQKLVGFMLDADIVTPPQECHLVIDRTEIAGRVTSIAFSPTLQRYIGLASITPELMTKGKFAIRLSDRSFISATICPTPFYDPDNTRQKEVIQRQEVNV
ncbi:2Fe-2S iron-sulfur cluster-binding protein [Aliterella atlantica]|uniref:Aminomethyltransferase n=1 Tax=Aliterella atlantica CENA595 TaxID=1618023 RepID=A0A0D8ZXS1_9CYAN|nr:2Fe-2S iron-sulfur cluster-binding protein [Aliterella atlantica]KJH73570.1 aminomethyltransferase [Aliterella atlantica CENA595]